MKIGLVCPDFPPALRHGGVSHYSGLLAEELITKGHRITAFAGDEHKPCDRSLICEVCRLQGLWDRATALSIENFYQSARLDVLNVQYSPAAYPPAFRTALPGLLKKTNSALSLHSLWGGGMLSRLQGYLLVRSASKVIATNSEILYLIRKWMPWALQKTRFVPIGPNIMPDSKIIDSLNIFNKYGVRGSHFVLMYFGMIYNGKGLHILLEAVQKMVVEEAINIKLLVVGGGVSDLGNVIDDLKAQARRFDLGDRVVFTGPVDAKVVSALYARADVAVLPYESGVSDRRGSLMAALAHGKAIVTTPPRIPIPHFQNGLHMLFCDRLDPSSLSKTIKSIILDPELKAHLEQGAVKLVKGFRWERIASDTEYVFREVMHA